MMMWKFSDGSLFCFGSNDCMKNRLSIDKLERLYDRGLI
jgi:hypothetical protein